MYGDVCLEKTYRIPATLRCSFSLLRQSGYFGRKNVTIILASVDARPLRTPQNATFDLSSATQNDYCVHPLRTQQTDYMPSTRAFRTNVRNLYLQRRKQIHTRYGLILNMALQQYTRYRVRVYPPFLHWQWHTATQKNKSNFTLMILIARRVHQKIMTLLGWEPLYPTQNLALTKQQSLCTMAYVWNENIVKHKYVGF